MKIQPMFLTVKEIQIKFQINWKKKTKVFGKRICLFFSIIFVLHLKM